MDMTTMMLALALGSVLCGLLIVVFKLRIIGYCIFLVSGFILLMMAKERSDQQVAEIQKSLAQKERQFQRVVETAIEGILMFDNQFRITFVNERMAAVLGFSVDEMLGRDYADFVAAGHQAVARDQELLRRSGRDSVYECCLVGKDGREHWFLVSATAVRDDSGRFAGSFSMLTDITERKAMELALEESNRRLMELSNTDSLTGIANRRCFDAALEREYTRLKRSESKLTVILLDVDFFKEYNDHYGHVAGDECLRQIGALLAGSVHRSLDLAARYGGEEFACILPDTAVAGGIEVARRIRDRIAELGIEHAGSPIARHITASFGITTVKHAPDLSPAEIIRIADRMLYEAKARGRNRIVYVDWSGEEPAVHQEAV